MLGLLIRKEIIGVVSVETDEKVSSIEINFKMLNISHKIGGAVSPFFKRQVDILAVSCYGQDSDNLKNCLGRSGLAFCAGPCDMLILYNMKLEALFVFSRFLCHEEIFCKLYTDFITWLLLAYNAIFFSNEKKSLFDLFSQNFAEQYSEEYRILDNGHDILITSISSNQQFTINYIGFLECVQNSNI